MLKSPRFILAAAFVFRLWSLNTYVQQHPKRALGAIPFLFEPGNIAFSLYSGNGFGSPFRVETGPTAWMTPVYPGLLAGIFHLFGPYTFDAFLSAALANVAFSAFAVIPLYFAAKRLGGVNLAATAGWLWAIFPNALLLTYQALWDASLGALLATIILWATLALRESERVRDWIGYGLLWGLTLMTTAALGALLPFLLIWAGWKRRLGLAAIAAGVAVVCCVPWTVRNYRVFHTLVPLRTVMGLSMWLGNNEKANGIGTANLHPISNSAERARYIELGEIAYNAEKQSEALHFMAAHPVKTLEFSALRFVAIWSGGAAHPLADFLHPPDPSTSVLWFRWVLGFNLLAAVFSAIALILPGGFFNPKQRNPMGVPLAAYVLVFPLAYYITLAPPRYRHPIDPALMLLSAVTLQAICQTVYRRFVVKSPAASSTRAHTSRNISSEK